jgi:hypothetical protein|tara:strand:+ start:176 stop:877 length:702 start_codon:yes stop_codon:yes gene_type:complete
MRNLSKYLLSIIFISYVTFLAASENIYEYKIRFKIKNVISLDGIKELKSKDNDTFHIIFTGKNRMLNAELNQEAEFKYLNSKIFPKYYSQKIKIPLRGELMQSVNYDFKNQKITSTGDVNWVIDFLGESTPLDPLSSGFQIRENVKRGLTSFDINLIKLDEGLIYKSSYTIVGEEILEIKDTKYPCVVLERTSFDKKTLYYVAKTLDFILIKVSDDRKDRMLSIEAEKILSFG